MHQVANRFVVVNKSLAHGHTVTILDTHCEDVGVVEHKVALVDWDLDIKLVGNECSSSISLELFLNKGDGFFDGIRALRTRFISPHENVEIEMSEVLDGMDDARAGPSTDSMVRILALEPGGESTRVATSDYDPVCLVAKVFILTIDE